MGNALVADDMEQANRTAFGVTSMWKVVALAGQVIDTAGTMSGGGNQAARGRMSSKLVADVVWSEVLRWYEQDSQDAVQEAGRALREAEEELEKLKLSGPQIEKNS